MKEVSKIIWKNKKGKAFEDLVYLLLNCMFPDTIFKQTNYVHDGGKDFYSIGNIREEKIWVEAKNYNNHLELSKFSNTFIMADISEINRIIIFSMSEITKGAKTNIARYAAYHRKSISVYAGNDILFLLKKYRDNIDLNKYIENTELLFQDVSENNDSELNVTVTYEYYHAKQFNLAYRHDKENHIKRKELAKLPLQSLIAQEIQITNYNLFQNREINLDFSEYENVCFETYFQGTKSEYIVIPPASTYILVVFFKIAETYGKIGLPKIGFDNSIVDIESSPYQVECCWLGEIPYIGDSWETLQNTVQLLDKDFTKKIVIIEGKSGVGKTRFLQEISGYYFQKGYRIISLDFRSMTNLSLKSALQNILSNLYVLDNQNKESVTYIENFGELYKDFYDIIFNESYDCVANINKLCTLFVSLFRKKQILLLIDNMQDIATETSNFFQQLLSNINNHNDIRSYIILCFNKDFLFQGKASYNLFSYIKQLNASYLVELREFNKGDARVYLLECLDPRRLRPDLHVYFDTIIEQFGTNPFILKQLMLYLKQRNIISFVDSMICISNFADMKIVLSELPKGIEQILKYRYSYLLYNTKLEDERSLDRIVWSILFLGKLKTNWISNIHFEAKGIQALMDYGFIEYNDKSEIVFCHQLIEKSFCLFFLGNQYIKNPSLAFINDEEFLRNLFLITNRVGKINLCVENMLLRTRLNEVDADNFNLALKTLANSSPRAIMIPLIINSLTDCLNCGVKAEPTLEFKAVYAISLACQERFDVYMAARYTSDLVNYEQETYREKLSAKKDIITFFKNYVFQLPINEKFSFLDWLIDEADNFCLSQEELQSFLGWLHNRYSKNLCSIHRYREAEKHAQEALKIALDKNDFCSAAEAEIEYGNIFAYNDTKKTARHWKNCVEYILKSNSQTTYFNIYKLGYYILSAMLDKSTTLDLSYEIKNLLELRDETFLYQKLFIDDIYADYYIIQYLDGKCSYESFKKVIPKLIQMKAESYMHTPHFTILATYKLFTVYRLICNEEATTSNIDTTVSFIYELIKCGIFTESKLPYSTMILYEIFKFCQKEDKLTNIIYHELPDVAKKVFDCMKNAEYETKFKYAVTPLSDDKRQLNLLHFNYVF